VRRRVAALLFLVTIWLVLPVGEAVAHGFGVRYDIPVPFWLYAYGAAAAVVLTFVLLVDTRPLPHRYPRLDLLSLRWFRDAFAGGPLLFGLRLLPVALFFLVVAIEAARNTEHNYGQRRDGHRHPRYPRD
jgi:hypothetical protein